MIELVLKFPKNIEVSIFDILFVDRVDFVELFDFVGHAALPVMRMAKFKD
jgi:hypothetical protein